MNETRSAAAPWTTASVITLIVGLIVPLLAPLVPLIWAPQFKDVFAGFGMDLPLLTRVFFNYRFIAWALLPLVVLAALLWPQPKQRAWVAAIIGIVGSALLTVAFFIAMYLPIARLASAT